MKTFLISPGHGRNTPGKHSFKIPPGIYEYEFNRSLSDLIYVKAQFEKAFKIVNIKPEIDNISLTERVRRANEFWKADKNCVYVCIHANAINNGGSWDDSAHGYKAFVCNNCSSQSRLLADMLCDSVSKEFSKNRGVAIAGFTELTKTKMPAVLCENGFMTHSAEATKLASDYWRNRIADRYIETFRAFVEVTDGN